MSMEAPLAIPTTPSQLENQPLVNEQNQNANWRGRKIQCSDCLSHLQCITWTVCCCIFALSLIIGVAILGICEGYSKAHCSYNAKQAAPILIAIAILLPYGLCVVGAARATRNLSEPRKKDIYVLH